MYRIPISMHNRLMRGEVPIVYCQIDTHMGKRIYAEKEINCSISSALEQSARILSFGSFERTLQPRKDDVLASYQGKQLQHVSLELNNADLYFSKLIAKEPFIGRPITIKVGFEADASTSHISLFTGTVTEMSVLPVMTIDGDER